VFAPGVAARHSEQMAATWLTETFGITLPIVGAPMFGVGAGRYATAVSSAGGLGVIGAGSTTSAEWISRECAEATASGLPYGVGLMAWSLDQAPEQLAATLAARPAMVSVSFGDIARYVGPLREAGIVVVSQAGDLEEARLAQAAGVDAIVTRGGEAGGHGRNDVATLVLLQEVLDATSLPVLAAGGISTSRGVAAVLAAGAAGAWVGTAFLTCVETETSDAAVARLVDATDIDTRYGRVFDVGQRLGWPPEFGGRSLRNDFFDSWQGREEELRADDAAVKRLAAAKQAGDFSTAYVYAGQGAAFLRSRRTVAEVMAELGDYQTLLDAAAGRRPDTC
jgi:nitronate monooxygenase